MSADTPHLSAISHAKPPQQTVPDGFFGTVQVDLFIASFLALFLEVMLIRWVPSYERVLAYFTNFILVSSFLGLGLGAILAHKRRDWMALQLPVLFVVVVISVLCRQYVKTLGAVGDILHSDFRRTALVSLSLPECLAMFFLLITIVFVPLGQRIGRCLAAIPSSLEGYTLNILGSVAGVVIFAVISWLQLNPWWWFLIALGTVLWMLWPSRVMLPMNLFVAILTIALVWWAGRDYIWTPYNKLTVRSVASPGQQGQIVQLPNIPTLAKTPGFNVAVNDDFFQEARDLSVAGVEAHPEAAGIAAYYNLPYELGRNYQDVLIVGAGTGNDVAAALRHGAEHVDAVEIDPAIAHLGQVAHPEQPYSDPRVNVFVDDARSYFNKTDRKYDLIVFGLLDSHRLLSGMSSVRLDSFVYTLESFNEARSLLKSHGLVCVQHGLGERFTGDRLYRMLEDAFGTPPGVLGKTLLTFLDGPGLADFRSTPNPLMVRDVPPTTDDWPFFWMTERQIPIEYRTSLEMMFLIAVILVLVFTSSKPVPITGQFWHFFFLGAAFLLIETVSVTRFALLFGSTWIVNSIVFTAILLTVLLANLWARRAERISSRTLYSLLAIGVVINFAAPLHWVLAMPVLVRLLAAVVLMGAPIFWAALIFARSFRDTHDVTTAFAANLLGAVVGGLTEYSALMIGFRNQLLIALAMYVLSYVALRWNLRPPRAHVPVAS